VQRRESREGQEDQDVFRARERSGGRAAGAAGKAEPDGWPDAIDSCCRADFASVSAASACSARESLSFPEAFV